MNDPATFILKNNYLITHRTNEFRSFVDVSKKMLSSPKLFPTGHHVMISIFESRIDLDADILEMIAKEISRVGPGAQYGFALEAGSADPHHAIPGTHHDVAAEPA